MQRAFAERLRCPVCRAAAPGWTTVDEESDVEVRTGALTCPRCGYVARVDGGIVDMLPDPPAFVAAEAAGLGRFADVMRGEGWDRERILNLPYEQNGYWYAQAVLMMQTLDTVPFEPCETILDVGSNTCWAAATFAQHGLAPTALDISRTLMQGLETADWQMEAKGVYLERVLGSMFDMPFADGSFDNVWCCEVLHHNHRANLARTYAEIYRVLKPGGRLIVANEPLRTVMTPKLNPGHEVAAFEGHEHAYMRHSYTGLARRAGFAVDVRGARYHPMFLGKPITDVRTLPPNQRVGAWLARAAQSSPRVAAALLAARSYVLGGTALHMVCTKPA